MDIYYRERQDNKVPINRIIPFSAVDGPGNRTAIFLQGCNIDCRYCHNPETRAVCIGCQECVAQCPTGAIYTKDDESKRIFYNKDKCVQCDRCIHICKYDASPKVEWLDARDVFEQVRKQVPFISGITVSGGECMLYPEFMEALFTYCHQEGLTTLIDSNGMELFESYPKLLEVTDGVMLDIKAYERADSIMVTGYENDAVLSNAKYLASIDKLEEIRTVVVEELFEPQNVITQIGSILKEVVDISEIRYKLIAFRSNGVREQYKHYKTPSIETMEWLKLEAQKCGFKKIIII